MPYSLTYLYRCLCWNIPRITDYQRFPSAPVNNGPNTTPLEYGPAYPLPAQWQWKHRGLPVAGSPTNFLTDTGTTAFLILQHGKIIEEQYFNGYNADAVNTSFSVAKSITSALVGIAIREGAIGSVQDSMAAYLPEFDRQGYRDITIEHLLQMRSGLAYREGVTPWSDDGLVYYGLDLRKQALKARLEYTPGTAYHYCNYNLLLLGMILERTTGMPVAQYLSERVWQPMGAEMPASWSTDSRPSHFAKMESGINTTARSFAQFGQLYLQQGYMNGQQIIPADWIQASVKAPAEKADTARFMSRMVPPLCKWSAAPHGYYGYLWWGYQIDPHNFDYFAMGVKGQFIYVCPRKQAVIVRFGKQWGKIDWWPELFKQIADTLEN
ncbi:CubicO group peptidase (beta-lactamase class C family) [Chitinophaga dinghuensis]|uniref:CubicO group peptidase (Beta-lactamase class C family) n=1 Tax=Chitinophaga dinghuensis TaxID=1539050 RepID=A0A327VIK3_9BACT|nr:serine hydrolase [Chitinophaga dinghuensis]RAJ73922.1 CubicO group peptidase (beta-lactamase class C family) [Chitinophaga dinghuensis]